LATVALQAELDEFWEWLADKGRPRFDKAATALLDGQPVLCGVYLRRALAEMREAKQEASKEEEL
jgi:hypothetical protein